MTARDVSCPTCGAQAGSGCVTKPWRYPARAFHIARRRKAQA